MFKTFAPEERTVVGMVLLGLTLGLFAVSRVNYLLFHALVEMFGVAVGLGISFLVFHARSHLENGAVRVLGAGFVFISVLSMLHAVAYKGIGVLPGFDVNLSSELWISMRLLTAGTFLTAPLFLGRPPRLRALMCVFAAVTAFSIWSVFSGYFPDCYVEGQGLTRFKIAMDILVLLALLAAGALFWRRSGHFEPDVLRLLLCCIGLSVLTGGLLSVYTGTFDLPNFLGHLTLLLSMLCLHRAVFVTGVAKPYSMLSQQLRQAEAQYRGIVDNSVEGLFQVAPSGAILAANPAFARVLGYADAAAAQGQTLLRHFPGGAEEFQGLLNPALAGGLGHRREMAALRLDGSRVWVSMSVRLAEGGQTHLTGSLRDISAEVQVETLRRDVERILRHELLSPLNGLVGLGRLLQDNEALPADSRALGRLIADTGWSLLRMIEESLILQRLEEGAYVPELKEVDLLAVLDRVRMWSAFTTGVKRLDVRVLLGGQPAEAGAACTLKADERLLEHALGNLFKNAVEAAPEDSRITVRIDGDVGGAGQGVRIVLHNQGMVPEDVRPRFFERYATSGKSRGTGLGTHIARLAVQALGGAIDFTTSEAEGTTLLVTLPPARPGP